MRGFFVRVGGVELACEEHGSGERALVLVHGYTGSRRDFAHVAPALAGERRRVVVVDQRGHGRSTWVHDERAYTIERLAEDLGATLDALALSRADLIAHSMGGQVALRLALAQPARVRSLVLVSTWAGGLALWPRPALRTRMIDSVPFLRQASDAIRRVRGEVPAAPLRDVDPAAYRALPRAMRTADLRRELGALALPTRVIVGAADAAFVPHAQALARVIPGASLSTIEHAGHQVMSERPSAFLEAVEAHLASVPCGAGVT